MDSYFLSEILKTGTSSLFQLDVFSKKKKRKENGMITLGHIYNDPFFRVASLARVNIFLILLPIKYISNVS